MFGQGGGWAEHGTVVELLNIFTQEATRCLNPGLGMG